MMKNLFVGIFLFVVIGFVGSSVASAQTALVSPCPAETRCVSFVGPDKVETMIQISNEAAAGLFYSNVSLDHDVLLAFMRQCDKKTGQCTTMDLTGRGYDRKNPEKKVNKFVRIDLYKKDFIIVHFFESDGREGRSYIRDGEWIATHYAVAN